MRITRKETEHKIRKMSDYIWNATGCEDFTMTKAAYGRWCGKAGVKLGSFTIQSHWEKIKWDYKKVVGMRKETDMIKPLQTAPKETPATLKVHLQIGNAHWVGTLNSETDLLLLRKEVPTPPTPTKTTSNGHLPLFQIVERGKIIIAKGPHRGVNIANDKELLDAFKFPSEVLKWTNQMLNPNLIKGAGRVEDQNYFRDIKILNRLKEKAKKLSENYNFWSGV